MSVKSKASTGRQASGSNRAETIGTSGSRCAARAVLAGARGSRNARSRASALCGTGRRRTAEPGAGLDDVEHLGREPVAARSGQVDAVGQAHVLPIVGTAGAPAGGGRGRG